MSDFDRRKWNDKYRVGEFATEPSRVITALAAQLPRRGRAIDIAGGTGRHALWLAALGLDVTLADISGVALDVAVRRAVDAGLALRTLEVDLLESPLPAGPWDVILSCCFLCRTLVAAFEQELAPGGTLIIVQPTYTNLTRHAKPPREFLFQDGELATLCSKLEIVRYEEGWLADDRHDAVLVARKPADSICRNHPDRL